MLSQCLIISLGLILGRRIPKGISDFYHNENTGRNGSLPTLGACASSLITWTAAEKASHTF